MKITKNSNLDVGYVQLRNGKVAETIEIRPGVLLDLDKKGEILGIEVLSLRTLAPALKSVRRRRHTSTRKKAA